MIKKIIKIAIIPIALIAVFFAYKYYQANVKATKIAFVRVPDYIYADYKNADNSLFITTKNFGKKDNLDELINYDVVYIFGMGFNPSQEQKENLKKVIEKNIPLYVYLSTSAEMDMTTLTKKELAEVEKFFKNPNKENNKKFLNYSRKILDAKSLFTDNLELAKEYPKNYFFHPSTEEFFEKKTDFEAYYKENNLHKKNAPKVMLLASNLQPSNPSARAPYFALINELETRGFNIYATAGFLNRVDFIKEVAPDLLIIIPHGRLAPGRSTEILDVLTDLNIPVLGPQVMYESYDDWMNNQKGLGGGMFSQNIIAPELDGVTTPFVIGAKFPRESDGVMIFKEIPERIESFSNLVENFLTLQTKENKDKKVSIFYYKGPGQNAIVSEGMEIVPSILNLLKHLQKEGYTTGELPKNSKELYAKIQKEGKLLGTYAKGTFEKFLKEGNPALIPADTLQKWMQKHLHPKLIKDVEEQYGALPGNYMTTVKDSIEQLAVARVQFGNIVLMPQPLPAVGEDEFKLVHGVKQATPYPYVGAYLWAREEFKADAIMHFGTHGSLEFTPYKQVGLSDLDWSHALIGDKPHFYIYTMGNVGEGMIAKRRSYATLISHLTPAFDESGFNSDMQKLHDAYHSISYAQTNASLQEQYKEELRNLVLETKLDKQLNFKLSKDRKLSEEELEKIAKYVHAVEAEKITLGLYTLGKTFSESKLKSTVTMMSYDPIAFSKAQLDVLKGKINEKQKNDPVFFDTYYRVPTLKLLKNLLKTEAEVIIEDYIDKTDLEFLAKWEKENKKGDFEKAMAGMIAMFEKIGVDKTISNVEFNKKLVTELMVKLMPDPNKKAAIEHLKDPLQFEKSSSIIDRTTLKKVKAIAKMIPKMQEMLDIMLQPDMFELLQLMQNEENYQLVFSIMEDSKFLDSIKDKENQLQDIIIEKLLLEENRKFLFSAIKDDFLLIIKNKGKQELQKIDTILNFYIDKAFLAEKIKPKTTDEEILVKVLESKKSIEKVKLSLEKINNKLVLIKQNEKTFAKAVKDIKTAILSAKINYENLKTSPQRELKAITNSLNGGFITPSSGGDAVRNPASVPSGRNLYSLNAEHTPTKVAWKLGVKMADKLLQNHLDKNNEYPKKIAFTLWGGEFIRSEGSNIAQIFYMLGVEPIWSASGNVKNVKLIPIEELGRPRIDIVVQTSGQFRDFASSRIFLIDKAVALASSAKDEENTEFQNFVKEGALQMEKDLKIKGFTPEEARKFSTARVFGAVNGGYGAGIMGMVEKGDSWEKDSEIADQYIKNMGAIYTEDSWGEFKPGLFESSIKNTEMVVHSRSANTWGALSLDHVYEFMGGLTNAVRNTTGKDPDGYFVDTRSKHNAFVQTVDEAIWTEAQSTLFNPKYITELMNGEASSADVFAETTRDMYGWNVMKPSAIDNELWDKMHKVYVQDEYEIGVKSFFERENPYALQEVTAVMLETIRKGYWKPDPKVIKEISELHVELVNKHTAACSGFVCDNAKLKDFISKNISDEADKQYQEQISSVRETSGEKQKTKKNIELKKIEKEKTLKELITDNKTVSYMVLALFLLLIGAFIFGRFKRK